MKKVIIFGTGSGGEKVYNFISQFHEYEVCLFLDNYPKSKKFLGLQVIQAEEFLNDIEDSNQYLYCIGSVYRDEINNQLICAGIDESHIYSKFKFLLKNKKWFMNQLIDDELGYKDIVYNNNSVLIFDLLNGFGIGGVEKWSYNLATEYSNKKEVVLLGNKSEGNPPQELVEESFRVDIIDGNDYNIESIKKIIKVLVRKLPCTVYCAHVNNLLIACIALKQVVGDKLQLVSVIHGGLPHILNDNIDVYEYVDYCLCVSPDSKKYMEKRTKDDGEKILFKESPVVMPSIEGRKYTLDLEEPIKIAYAARLEKTHKRSELLIPFITQLEKKNINYKLNVAGNGSLFDRLCEFIKESKLDHKVNMLGRLRYEEMAEFWMNHDIAINLSECEGCSIAMLESMSTATVPIFTNVFSTEHFITNQWNGFVAPFNDIDAMVNHVEELAINRDNLAIMGKRARKVIEEKCDLNNYICYLDKNISEIY